MNLFYKINVNNFSLNKKGIDMTIIINMKESTIYQIKNIKYYIHISIQL